MEASGRISEQRAYGQNQPGMIFSLATDKAGNIYAGGELMDSTGNYYISKWDGHSWTEIGTGTHALHANGIIYSIIPDANGNIYTAGQFTNAAGKFYVAKWNGSDWSEVGSGTGALNANSNINSLAIDAGGNLYAAGNFRDASGYQYVAEWNGSSWNELGTGSAALNANDMINVIAFDACRPTKCCRYVQRCERKLLSRAVVRKQLDGIAGHEQDLARNELYFFSGLRPLRKYFCRGRFYRPQW